MSSPSSSHQRARTSSRPPPPIGVVVPSRDPLATVMELGKKKHAVAVAIGLIGALLVHGSAAARVALIDVALLNWTKELRFAINEKLGATYDIDVEKPKEPEPPPPEAPKPEEPKEEAKPAEPPPKAETKEATPPPPPAAAQAAAVETAPPDNEPVDFTNSFVTGNGETFAGGVTQAGGTSTTAVYDRHAQAGGVPGGTGTAPAPPKTSAPDRSRVLSSKASDWNCSFPPEADTEQIDEMKVPVEITVGPDGRVLNVRALKDPGYGFGRAAVQCAQRQQFNVAMDRDGNAIQATRAFNVHFER